MNTKIDDQISNETLADDVMNEHISHGRLAAESKAVSLSERYQTWEGELSGVKAFVTAYLFQDNSVVILTNIRREINGEDPNFISENFVTKLLPTSAALILKATDNKNPFAGVFRGEKALVFNHDTLNIEMVICE